MSGQVPIIDALAAYAAGGNVRMHMPGHKGGQGMVHPSLRELLGEAVFAADVTNIPMMDDLHQPSGIINEAQERAARTFGADATYFLVNGASCGLMALVLSACQQGDEILLPRNMHRSILSGVILSGAVPVFFRPACDAELLLPLAVSPETVHVALEAHPQARAVFLVSPNYHGITSDIRGIAEVVHQYGIPLLVDEAHGPHLGFHHEMPPRALDCGADASVQGTHKTLGSFTQSAMLHLKGSRVDRVRLGQGLRLLQSTSTSYLLLASLDGARADFAARGKELLGRALEMATGLRQEINAMPQLFSFDQDWAVARGAAGLDRTKVTVTVKGLGVTGLWAETWLKDHCQTQVEMSDLHNLLVIITAGNSLEDMERLIDGLREMGGLAAKQQVPQSFSCSDVGGACLPPDPPMVCTPREAFFRPSLSILLEQAVGRAAAETVACYPPGIPVLCPGERITQEIADYLMLSRNLGMHFQGPADATLNYIRVLA